MYLMPLLGATYGGSGIVIQQFVLKLPFLSASEILPPRPQEKAIIFN